MNELRGLDEMRKQKRVEDEGKLDDESQEEAEVRVFEGRWLVRDEESVRGVVGYESIRFEVENEVKWIDDDKIEIEMSLKRRRDRIG